MFIKKRKKPLTLQKLDALIPRLSSNNQLSYLKRDAAKLQKGYNGERRLDYYLRSLSDEFYILSDVSLEVNNRKFQIDSLIISPHAMYLIEVKNFEGILTFDTIHRQMIQTNNNREKSFTYPITQAENTSYLLMKWLERQQLPTLPIQSYIAIAQKNTIIRVHGEEELITKYIMQAEVAALRIINSNKIYEQTYQGNSQRRNKVTSTIMSHLDDLSVDVIKKYKIKQEDIKSGTRCLSCLEINMTHNYGKWICLNCNQTSIDAHMETINDFLLLNKNIISINEAMKFLKLPNRYQTYRILKKIKLKYNKTTKYWERKK